MPTPTASLQTPIGVLGFFVEVGNWDAMAERASVDIRCVPLRPALPEGMAVAACHAVTLRFVSPVPASDLQFFAYWTNPAPQGALAHSGERLEAQGWSSDRHVVMVGTEDREGLSWRLHNTAALDPAHDPVLCTGRSIATCIDTVYPGCELTLHFVVACNPLPEPVALSCWFAVDQPHERLLRDAG